MKVLRAIKNQFQKFHFLLKADAPWWVMAKYYALHTSHYFANRHRHKSYHARKLEFRRIKNQLSLDSDWFTGNIPTWLRFLDEEGMHARPHLNCLEIGSWQGLSAYFLLSQLGNARLTCVDTWEGADEHKAGKARGKTVLSRIEQSFDANLAVFGERVKKYKGASFDFFAEHFKPSVFDLIYVDGSHHSDDVIVDAIKCFEMLKVGGVMVFDDYFWRYYDRVIDNPAGALNMFLRLKMHQLKIIGFDYQLVIRKTADSVRFTQEAATVAG